MAKAGAKPKRKANGYKMPDPLPLGLIIEDLAKQRWKLGPSIGKGGFGEIYSAQKVTESSKANSKYPFVVKIEPHTNGPLFVEMHFYVRNTKPDDIERFKSEHKLKSLGIPEFIGAGSHEHSGEKYRFVVMHKFSTDLWKVFLEHGRSLPEATVFQIAIQIVDALEYIHSRQYVHADIKGQNILLDGGRDNQVYLVDFGLCTRYATEHKPDPKKAHDGTIEYVSRDGHLGVPSRRGDLEILGYNLVHWLGGDLPWEKIKKPADVQASKEKHMSDLNSFLKTSFGNKKVKDALVNYLKYVTTLKFGVNPDYVKIRKILADGLAKAGGSTTSPIKFKAAKKTSKTPSPDRAPKKARVKVEKKVEMPVEEASEDDPEDETAGYTAEMLRIKSRMDVKKNGPKLKKAVSKENLIPNGAAAAQNGTGRDLRRRQAINYKEDRADAVPKKANNRKRE